MHFAAALEQVACQYPALVRVTRGSPEDIEAFQRIVESEGMSLGGGLELYNTRRPELLRSFHEANHDPYLVVDESRSSLCAALSDTQVLVDGQPTPGAYTSDLRISDTCPTRTRKAFLRMHHELIRTVSEHRFCTSAILDRNTRAIRALTRGLAGVHYHPLFRYGLRTILLNPLLRAVAPRGSFTLEARSFDDPQMQTFVAEHGASLSFAHEALPPEQRDSTRYGLLSADRSLLAVVDVLRPQWRHVRFRSQKRGLRRAARWLSDELPWSYLSTLALAPALDDHPSLLPELVGLLVKQGALPPRSLLVLAHELEPRFAQTQQHSFFSGCFQVFQTGTLYEVSLKKTPRLTVERFRIDPFQL